MTKAELSRAVAHAEPSLSAAQAETAIDGLIRTLSDELQAGRDIHLPKLGTFKVKTQPARPERQGRNPRTGATLTIAAKPAHRVVRFKAAKGLVD